MLAVYASINNPESTISIVSMTEMFSLTSCHISQVLYGIILIFHDFVDQFVPNDFKFYVLISAF